MLYFYITKMLKGIGIGIGFILGILIFLILLSIVILLIFYLRKSFMRKNFSPELFYKYRQFLIKKEKFEELKTVNSIISKLEKKEKPKELLKNYTIDIDSYFFWLSYENGDRLTIRHDKKIIRINN